MDSSPPSRGRSRQLIQSALVVAGLLSLSGCSLLGLAASAGMVKLQFGCLPEGTPVDTPGGPVAVESLRAGDTVIGFEGEPVTVLQVHEYLEDPRECRHLTLHFEGGSAFALSPRHRVAGRPAGELRIGSVVAGRSVEAVTPRLGVARSFDLLTGDAGYRIHGVPVNSMIEEMAAELARGGAGAEPAGE